MELWERYHLDKMTEKYGVSSTVSMEDHPSLQNIPGNRSIVHPVGSRYGVSLEELARKPLSSIPIRELDQESIDQAFSLQPGPIPGFDPAMIGIRKEEEITKRKRKAR
jgi:hypothetical protein